MTDQLGTGYLLSIARRGAASVARPGQRTASEFGERESSFCRSGGQTPAIESVSQMPPPTTSMTASAPEPGSITSPLGPAIGQPSDDAKPADHSPEVGDASQADSRGVFWTLEETGARETPAVPEGPAFSLPPPTLRPSLREAIGTEPQRLAARDREGLNSPPEYRENQEFAQGSNEGRNNKGHSTPEYRENQEFAQAVPSSATVVYELATDPAPAGDASGPQPGEVSSGLREASRTETHAPSDGLALGLPIQTLKPPQLPRESVAIYPASRGEPQTERAKRSSSATTVDRLSEATPNSAPARETSESPPPDEFSSRREAVTIDVRAATSDVSFSTAGNGTSHPVTRDVEAVTGELTLAPPESHTSPRIRESLLAHPANSAGRQPLGAPAVQEPGRLEHRVNEVFEIRMPENFFEKEKEAVVAAGSYAESRVRDYSSAALPSVPARITDALGAMALAESPGARTPATRATPKDYNGAIHSGEAREPGSVSPVSRTPEPSRLLKPDSQVAPQPAAVAPAGLNRAPQPAAVASDPSIAKRSSVIPAAPPEPRNEQATRYGRRESPGREAARSSQPRLRINRLEIQVINQPMAPQPPVTNAPDTGQLLERRLLGRTDMIS